MKIPTIHSLFQLLLLPTLSLFAQSSLETNLKTSDYSAVAKELKKQRLGLQTLKKMAKKTKSVPLQNAIYSTKKILAKTSSQNLRPKELVQACFYCQTQSLVSENLQSRYLKAAQTNLPYDIEYDAESKRHFIVLKGKKAYIGKGKKKVVTRSIMYHKRYPKVVARAEQSANAKNELKITKKVRGADGLFQTYAICKSKRHGTKYNTIYSKLYHPGSLQAAFEKNLPLSLYEKIKVAMHILDGLQSLHTKAIVHRDLGARNYLIKIPKGAAGYRNVEACIADFGRANYVSHVKDTKIQGNTTYTAPEGIYREKMNAVDYFQTDVFAVGCVFYRLFYNQKAPWQDISYIKNTNRTRSDCYNELVFRIKQATEHRRQRLAWSQHRSIQDEFELLILSMLQIEPERRGSSVELSQKIQQIYQQAKASM